ncbi:Nn.00g100760.m01.CDS01 [Neocucurbitaria sp. VM-36]
MPDAQQDAPAPKKRSFFKRAAWQDAAKKDGADMFSHANEFSDIVAAQDRRIEEDAQEAQRERRRTQAAQHERKRRKVSLENGDPTSTGCGVGSRAKNESGSKVRSRTHSPAPSSPVLDSLTARYDSLTKFASSKDSLHRKESVIIDLDDLDDQVTLDHDSKPFDDNVTWDNASRNEHREQVMPILPSKRACMDEYELEENPNPTLAALEAKARQRAALKAQFAAAPTADGEPCKAPVAQLFIKPEIPDANPLMVKVRIDSTIEKPRQAWCGKQGFSADMTRDIIFTWKGTRIYDSTTIKRLGMQVDKNGNVSVDGDSNIYDDVNLPKVVVQAWTEELFKQRQKEDAAVKETVVEDPPVVEEREPIIESAIRVTKIRLILKAKGRDEFRLSVNPDTTFAHIAQAYKSKLKIDKNQPLTLTFDGDRLSPLDTVADTEIEDMDAVEVLFK